jgi:hypothetical protein
MSKAARQLVNYGLNIQFAESAISGHHHATWNIVAEAAEVRHRLTARFASIQALPDRKRVFTNEDLRNFANELASPMFRKELRLPSDLVAAHREEHDYVKNALDCGFLHNRIVDGILFFYDPTALPDLELVGAAQRGLPQPVACRWMQNLAFFSIYGDTANPMRLHYDAHLALLTLSDPRPLGTMLEQAGQPTTLPARAVASFDTSELYLRIEIIDPNDAWDRHLQADIAYDITFRQGAEPGIGDITSGIWSSSCTEAASQQVDLIRIANRTTHRDAHAESGTVSFIGKTARRIDDSTLELLRQGLKTKCSPIAPVAQCSVRTAVHRLGTYRVFFSRRTTMPQRTDIDELVVSLGSEWGLSVDVVQDPWGQMLDAVVQEKILGADGIFQIISYSKEELIQASSLQREALPDLQWLFHEYAMAIGAGKQHVRIIDLAHRDRHAWSEVIHTRAGEATAEYRSNDDLAVTRAKLSAALGRLAHDIDAHRRRR